MSVQQEKDIWPCKLGEPTLKRMSRGERAETFVDMGFPPDDQDHPVVLAQWRRFYHILRLREVKQKK